jgi:uncharacterized protein YdeI (YjbR/CyaY-like superfamily)
MEKTIEFYAKDRYAWRKWLEKNHATASTVWLLMYKKESETPSVYYDEAVEEALCFGWIDSKPRKNDADSYFLYFAERKPKSVWSKLNKTRIEKLLKQGLMRGPGMAKIEAAKKDGSWTALDAIEEYIMPNPLAKALKKSKIASENFSKFPPGVKKAIYQWIVSAKTEATITKRVVETVEKAGRNIRANQWKPKS